MYVIRIRRGDDPWKYFYGIENKILVISSIPSKAMIFERRTDALIMAAFIEDYFLYVRPFVTILPLTEDELIDFSVDQEENYFEL